MLIPVMKMKLRIRDLREDHDLKQKQIAEYLLCDQSLYSKYERNERPLPLEYACKLADYCRLLWCQRGLPFRQNNC